MGEHVFTDTRGLKCGRTREAWRKALRSKIPEIDYTMVHRSDVGCSLVRHEKGYCVIVYDDTVLYEGTDEDKALDAFARAKSLTRRSTKKSAPKPQQATPGQSTQSDDQIEEDFFDLDDI